MGARIINALNKVPVKCRGIAEEEVLNFPRAVGSGRISEGSGTEVVKCVCVGEGHLEDGESLRKGGVYTAV